MNPTNSESIIAQLQQRIEIQESQLRQQAIQIAQLQQQWAALNPPRDGQLFARHEVERLHKEGVTLKDRLDKLQQYVEERVHSLNYFEEQRRNDARRLSELQGELPNLQKKVELAVMAKIQVLEQKLPHYSQYQLELENIREDIRRDREALSYQIAERERQIKLWLEQAETHEQRIHKYNQSLERYEDQYLTNRRTLETLQDFQERLQRDQHQTNELQRLTEERLLASFEKWKNEYEQRWQGQTAQWKPGFSDLQRTLQTLQTQITEIQKFNRAIEQQMDLVLRILEEDVQQRVNMAEQWQKRFEQIATQG